MASYKIVLALPVVVTLLVWLSERTSISEIEVTEDGLTVTSHSGDTVRVGWPTITEAIHNRPRRILSRPLWEFRNKAGEKLLIPSGIFPRKKEDEFTSLITGYLPEKKIVKTG